MDKTAIRLLVKTGLQSMTAKEKQDAGQKACAKIITFLGWKTFDTLIAYEALFDEIDVSRVWEWCEKHGKNITVMPQNNLPLELTKNSIILVPWRAFTLDGKRIGRGGGYYDQLLAKNPSLIRIGVCFGVQIFSELPQDDWDEKMHHVFVGS